MDQPRSRRVAWHRDELVLALDLYISEGMAASAASIAAVSSLLRRYPTESHLAANPRFRSEAAVRRKLANFLAIESEGHAGLTHAGRADREVWDEFAQDPAGLREAAQAIRAKVLGGSSGT